MTATKPIIVYGASGYTGRLVCEYLREYGLPFIAAGRNAARLAEVMSKVPGIESADYEVVQVEHTVEALTDLFSGAQVVCNTVGPFEYYGIEVVEACLNSGCHYIDTTGEPQFIRMARDQFSDAFKAADLALAPSVAYMYAPLDICAHYCLETEGIDSLEGVASAGAIPTFASTQSIFALLKTPAQYLENNTWAEWPAGKGYETIVPGHAYTMLAHPWGGGSLPLWFEHDSRVQNCKQLTCFTDRPMFESVIELQQHYEENIKPLPLDEQQKALSEIAESMQPGEPPRENRLIHRTIDTVVGTGTAVSSRVTLQTGGAYFQTGIYQAASAHKLINEGTMKAGFASPCQMVGHEYLLGQLRNFLPTELTIE
jgi:short subunit dehydrogenase-like uncharacterized protein